MGAIFFLIRLPFFLVAVTVYATLGTCVGVVLWLTALAFLVLVSPLLLISAAFQNNSKMLTEPFKEWIEAPAKYFHPYENMFHWLIHGS